MFCKDHFPNDLLYPECCHEFHLLTKDSDVNEEYVVTKNTLRYQEIDDSHYDNHFDALNIVLNASFKDDCDDDPIIHFENLKNDEQIDISAGDNFRSTVNTKGSLEFLDLHTKWFAADMKRKVKKRRAQIRNRVYIFLRQRLSNSHTSFRSRRTTNHIIFIYSQNISLKRYSITI